MAKLTGGRALLRGRRRLALAAALLGAAVLIPATSSSGATGTISVVDYSQCANGTGTGVDCNQNWINGILQKSNSHFKEGDVTPQRAIVTVSGNGQHSITLKYQARKGTTHAYDSLATWNHTVTDADRCANLTTTVQTAIACSTSTPTDTLAITADNTAVSPFTSPATGVTSTHDLDGQELQLYSADGTAAFVAMTSPTHDQATCSNKCADDYATTTISFNATSGSTVEILFGGHLAVSPTNRGGWGAGLGASNISGGPYHIKWDAADGGSVGNRDNQIMGDAIQALSEPGISTSASPQTATIGTAVTLADTVTLSGATDPTGAVTMSLYGPFTTATGNTCTGTPVALGTITYGAWAKTGGGTGLGTWTRTGTAPSYTFPSGSAGIYFWVTSVAADNNNTAAGPHGCNESTEAVTVSLATPGGSTTILLDDSVSVTGNGTITPTGTVTFSLFQDDSGCTDTTKRVYTSGAVSLVSGSASTTANTTTVSGSVYRWLVTYSGDGVYSSSTVSNCTEAATIA